MQAVNCFKIANCAKDLSQYFDEGNAIYYMCK